MTYELYLILGSILYWGPAISLFSVDARNGRFESVKEFYTCGLFAVGLIVIWPLVYIVAIGAFIFQPDLRHEFHNVVRDYLNELERN